MGKFDWVFEERKDFKDDGSIRRDTTEPAGFLSVKQIQKGMQRINRIKDLSDLPKKGEEFVYFVDGQFDAIDFLQFILQTHNKIDFLGMASYSYSKISANLIRNLVENGIVQECFLASTTSLRTRYPESYSIIESIIGNIERRYTALHAKILLVETAKNFYVLDGSGNFSKNARIEQYHFSNNEKLFNFYKENLQKIENKG